MRHEINNQLTLVVAALELARRDPQKLERMLVTLGEQPNKISQQIAQFSAQFERRLHITRP